MLALHNECLTRRYLLHISNFLEGFLGFGLGTLRAFEGCRKLGRLRLLVKLQTLVFFHESLELFLHLLHPRLLLPSLCALRSRSVFLRVATSVVAPIIAR